MSDHCWSHLEKHPPKTDIFLYLEGDLDDRKRADIDKHLIDCWECRLQCDTLSRGIHAFMDYRRGSLLNAVPPSPTSKQLFRCRMREAFPDLRLPSKLGLIGSLFRMAFPGRWVAAWVAVLSSTILVVSLLVPVAHPQKLTAAELIMHARASADRRLSSVDRSTRGRKIVYQKVELRRGNRAIDREVVLKGPDNAVASDSVIDSEWTQLLEGTPIDWRDPLGVARYDEWRTGNGNGEETVSEANGLATLTTAPFSASRIERASLTIRESDWHAVAKRVDFSTQPSIEVREIAYGERELPISENALIRPEPDRSRLAEPVLRSLQRPTVPTPLDQESKLAETEIRLREILHEMKADIQEIPQIRRDDTTIRVESFTQTCARRQDLLSKIDILPNVLALISCPDMLPLTPAPTPPPDQSNDAVYSSTPPLGRALEAFLGGFELSNAYLHSLRGLYQRFLVNSSALQGLAERYRGPEWQELSPGSRARVDQLAADYIRSIHEASQTYLQQVSYVLNEMLAEQKLSPNMQIEEVNGCGSWHDVASPLAERLRDLQSDLQLLFVEEKTTQPIEPDTKQLLLNSAKLRREVGNWANQLCELSPQIAREP